MATEAPFRLLDLPAELRNEIYRLAFEDSTTMLHPDPIKPNFRSIYIALPAQTLPRYPGILGANNQIHSECKLIFYTTSTIVATSKGALLAWLTALDLKSRSALKHVVLRHYTPMYHMLPSGLESFSVKESDKLKLDLEEAKMGFDGSVVQHEIWEKAGWEMSWPKEGEAQEQSSSSEEESSSEDSEYSDE